MTTDSPRAPRSRPGLSPGLFLVVGSIALVFVYFSRLPLSHLDLWGHLSWGRFIARHGALPGMEPFMPLAEGAPAIDTAWLAQLSGYAIYQVAGPTALQHLLAGCIVLCCLGLVETVRRRTRRAFPLLLALGVLVATQWYQWQIIRPQIAGQVAFIGLLYLLSRRRWGWGTYLAVFVLFALWANLHGSFPIGIAVMLLTAAGRALDLLVRERSLRRVFRDRWIRQLSGLALVAGLAGLANPRGIVLYREILQFSGHPNLRSLSEWLPLSFASRQGRIFLGLTALTLVGLPFVRSRHAFQQILPTVVLSLATFASARFIVWWGPLVGYLLARIADAFLARFGSRSHERWRGSPLWSGLTWAVVIIAICMSPFARRLATGKEPPFAEVVSAGTPLGAVAWLRSESPAGQIFNSYEWGDYLVWAGPENVPVFVTSHVHLIPPTVWNDYRAISRAAEGWETGLAKYHVETVLLDRARHARLVAAIEQSGRWTLVYSDRQAKIFARARA